MAMGDQERVQTRGLDHAVWPTEVHAVPLRPQMDFPKGTQANDSRFCPEIYRDQETRPSNEARPRRRDEARSQGHEKEPLGDRQYGLSETYGMGPKTQRMATVNGQRVCAEGYGEEEKERLMDVQPEAGTHGRQRPNVRDAELRRLMGSKDLVLVLEIYCALAPKDRVDRHSLGQIIKEELQTLLSESKKRGIRWYLCMVGAADRSLSGYGAAIHVAITHSNCSAVNIETLAEKDKMTRVTINANERSCNAMRPTWRQVSFFLRMEELKTDHRQAVVFVVGGEQPLELVRKVYFRWKESSQSTWEPPKLMGQKRAAWQDRKLPEQVNHLRGSMPASLDEGALYPVGLESRFAYLFDSPSGGHRSNADADRTVATGGNGQADGNIMERVNIMAAREKGVVHVLNQHGQTLMFAAAGRPSSKGGAEEICQVLEARGLDPSARDVYDQTPLFAAAQEGNLQCASWLISQGCHVNHSDLRGQTHSQMEMVLKLTNELGDLHGRRPPFFGNPIFRKAFIAKRKNQPETPSPKRRRLEREDSTALWKRFRGDLAYRCQGPEVMREWAFLDEDVPDDTVPKNCQVWASNNEYEVVVPPPEATPRIRVLERDAWRIRVRSKLEFLLDHADYLAGYELCRAMSPDEWADFSGVPVNEPGSRAEC
ncbi:Abnormal spindle-like microcephaly-associated protein-like [Durusdinium trenchii]|uniref:Abnormal spindle-like microcephaly-associated protein-like n=1 Tax=Durusdinium trenchii TaxID=1381693 RepID=A0ABP0IEG9_9DINO